MIKGLLLGLLCFILFLILHLVIFNLRPQITKRFRVLKNIFFIFIPVYVFLYILIPRDLIVLIPADPTLTLKIALAILKVVNFVVGFMLYAFLFMGYCQFYFFIDRSISGRMMIEIEESPQKQLFAEELKKIYPPEEVFKRRLRHMLESKLIIQESNYYKNTKKGHCIAVISKFLKEFLRLNSGG